MDWKFKAHMKYLPLHKSTHFSLQSRLRVRISLMTLFACFSNQYRSNQVLVDFVSCCFDCFSTCDNSGVTRMRSSIQLTMISNKQFRTKNLLSMCSLRIQINFPSLISWCNRSICEYLLIMHLHNC